MIKYHKDNIINLESDEEEVEKDETNSFNIQMEVLPYDSVLNENKVGESMNLIHKQLELPFSKESQPKNIYYEH